MICAYCRTELPNNASYCWNCGNLQNVVASRKVANDTMAEELKKPLSDPLHKTKSASDSPIPIIRTTRLDESPPSKHRFSRRAVVLGLATLSVAGGGIIWFTHTQKPPIGSTLFIYRGHSNYVLAAAWSPDGKRIASGSFDKSVQVWRAV